MKLTRLTTLGLFISIGVLLFVGGILLLGKKEKIFESTFPLYAEFNTVAGLREGAPVRLSGVEIGTVEKILLPEHPGGLVLVRFRLDRDAQHLIRKDAEAVIETEGLVGSKIVSIIGGSTEADAVDPGDVLRSRSPLALTAILESFDETANYMRGVTRSLEEITEKIRSGQGTIGRLVYEEDVYQSLRSTADRVDSVLLDVASEVDDLIARFSQVGEALSSTIERVQSGEGTLGALLYRDDVHQLLVSAINTVEDSIQSLLTDMHYGDGTIGKLVSRDELYSQLDLSVEQLVQFTQELQDLSRLTRSGLLSFNENMEALKHNWLFRGYFERRGFWTKAEFEKYYDEKRAELKQLEKQLKQREKELEEQRKRLEKVRKQLEKAKAELGP
jgi:phospholipid/cholesterol/gamma-HCH transport system substrate-binding protein